MEELLLSLLDPLNSAEPYVGGGVERKCSVNITSLMVIGATSTSLLDSLKSVYNGYKNHILVVDFKHVPEFMGQPSYIIGWAFQIVAIPETSAVHPRVLLGQLFLADGIHCQTTAFHRAIPLSEFLDCKISSLVAGDIVGYTDGVSLKMVVLAEAM